jgi:cob(I)alamin adenosyltransferase
MKPYKIVTRKGDSGTTSTSDGQRIKKSTYAFRAVGKIDTLHAQLGVAYATMLPDKKWKIVKETITKVLYSIMGELAATSYDTYREEFGTVGQIDIDFLETNIDVISKHLDDMNYEINGWVFYGTHNLVSAHLDLASKLCREAELEACVIFDNAEGLTKKRQPNKNILKYLNRLSDYLFLLSRFHEQNDIR